MTTLPPGPVRTYNARRGRMRVGRLDALHRLGPVYGLPAEGDLAAAFDRPAPLVLEIGSGMGETTVAMAVADPGRNYLAVEVHTAGVANLLRLLDEAGTNNVRVHHGDALALVRERVAPGSLAAVHVFFPDPWPKARHHERRLVQPGHVRLLAERLMPGGILHCATDDPGYAEAMSAVLAAEPLLSGGAVPRPANRPPTRYEARGLAAGRPSHDFVCHRVPA